MLRHENVTEDIELMPLPEPFESLEKDDSGVVVVEVGKPAVATEGDEVIVTERVVSLETRRHGSRVNEVRVPRSWTPFVHERDS